MFASSIAITDPEFHPSRHAGRGGPGAVMGVKGIKVIVLDDTGMKMCKPVDSEKFKAANKLFVQGSKEIHL